MLGVAGQMMGTLVDTEEEGQGRAQVSQMETLSMYKNWFLTITFIFIGQMSIIVHQSVLYNILIKSRSSTLTCFVTAYSLCLYKKYVEKRSVSNLSSPPPPSPKKKYFQDQWRVCREVYLRSVYNNRFFRFLFSGKGKENSLPNPLVSLRNNLRQQHKIWLHSLHLPPLFKKCSHFWWLDQNGKNSRIRTATIEKCGHN